MAVADVDEPMHQKPLRLWPGVAIVVVQWLARFVVPVFAPEAMVVGIGLGLFGGLAVVVWWGFFSRAPRPERWGGVALIMMVGFIGLAVPITIASIQTSAQLSRNSRVYDSRLRSMYGAGSGIEVAIWQILTDAGYYGALTPSNPSAQLVVDTNGDKIGRAHV